MNKMIMMMITIGLVGAVLTWSLGVFATPYIEEKLKFPVADGEDVDGFWGHTIYGIDTSGNRINLIEESGKPFSVAYKGVELNEIEFELNFKGITDVESLEFDTSSFETHFKVYHETYTIVLSRQYPQVSTIIDTDNHYHVIYAPQIPLGDINKLDIYHSGVINYRKLFDDGTKGGWSTIIDIPSLEITLRFGAQVSFIDYSYQE